MADSEEKKKTDDASKKDEDGKSKKGLPPVIILVVLIVVAAGGGIGVSTLLGPAGPDTATAEPVKDPFENPATETDAFKYHVIPSMTVNLVSPRGSKYLRITLSLKIKEAYYEKVTERIGQKKHEIKDMLNNYLGGQSLQDVLGSANQNRIKRELRTRLNELLWPDSKPGIYMIYLDEFQVS